MSTPPIDESAPLYSVNERCLCFHGPLIYEAKVLFQLSVFAYSLLQVLKAQNHDAATTPTGYVGMHYQVHYKGWKQTWDEWVPATRLLKFNEANLATQKALQIAERGRTSAAKKAVPTGSDAKKKDAPRGTKRARGQDEEGDTPAVASASGRQVRDRPDMRVNVPELLKVKLVDDWEAVTKSNQVRQLLHCFILVQPLQLVTLPRSPNVSQLLDEFEVWVKETEPEQSVTVLFNDPVLSSPPAFETQTSSSAPSSQVSKSTLTAHSAQTSSTALSVNNTQRLGSGILLAKTWKQVQTRSAP